MNFSKWGSTYFLFIAAFFLSGCEPHFAGNYYVSLEGDMADTAVDSRYLEIGSKHFFNKKISTTYEYKFGELTLKALVLQKNLPTVLFRLVNEAGDNEEISITSNHPCYSHAGAGMKLDIDDSNQFIGFDQAHENRSLALYKWIGFNPDKPITFSTEEVCLKHTLPNELTISIDSLDVDFKLTIPIKIKRAGFYMYIDGV